MLSVLMLNVRYFFLIFVLIFVYMYCIYRTRVSSQMEKQFCPSCGNKSLMKMSVSVDENGVTHYHMPNRKRPFNIRGKKVSVD